MWTNLMDISTLTKYSHIMTKIKIYICYSVKEKYSGSIVYKLKTTSSLKDYGLFKVESVPKLKVCMEPRKWFQWQSSAWTPCSDW